MTVLDDFVQRREAAARTLDELADILQPLTAEARHADQLKKAAARARDGRFVVLLLGCFSSGKSTLLNALLGRPVLPVKVNPCTAILTEVVYGEVPGVEVRHHDGRIDEHTVEDFLETYQLRTASEDAAGAEAADRFGGVDRAVVKWPLALLRNGVVLLDTPGLDDDPTRTARTLASLPDADAVIFTLSANRFLTDLERKTLTRDLLPLGLTNLFFPTTMVDLLQVIATDPEAELAALTERAHSFLGPLSKDRLFPLDARGALHARWDREAGAVRQPADTLALQSTGLAAFESNLQRFLIDERGTAQLAQLHATAVRIRGELARQAELDRATAETGVDELRARQAELEPRFEELSQVQRRLERTVDHFVQRTKTVVWQDLRAVMAEAEEELPAAVLDFDLGGLASLDLLTERGRARVESRLRAELEGWLDRRMATWQESLEPKLETALVDLRGELAADAADFEHIADSILGDFSGGSFTLPNPTLDEPRDVDPVERWFAVAVGALLLSPGAVAAGWSEGYEGAMKGAAGRLGVRLAILGLGALLGPIGWAGLVLYAVSDAVLLFTTGGTQLKKIRDKLAVDLEGKLVAQADAARATIEQHVADGLQPLREALVGAADNEVHEMRAMLEHVIAAREEAVRGAESRRTDWENVLAVFARGIEELATVRS